MEGEKLAWVEGSNGQAEGGKKEGGGGGREDI
jgi:hypothetical protein